MTQTSNSNGIGFNGLLTIVFIVMKLLHMIDWSWWWVLCPIWISTLLTIFVCFLIFLVYLLKTK